MKIRFALFVAAVITCASAQPSLPDSSGSRVLDTVDAAYSFSSNKSLTRGSSKVGEVAVHRYEVGTQSRFALGATTTLSAGLALASTDFDLSRGTPLPDQLNELALKLGLSRRFNERWSASLSLRPGLYGDFEDIDGKTFNVPVLALATYVHSRTLAFAFGFVANPYSEHPVLPIAGVHWEFVPGWSFDVGMPRTGVTWRPLDGFTMHAGVSFQGGTYRITENLGTPAFSTGRLANTFLDYRELRAGVGADLALDEHWSFSFDVGAVLDRTFDYFDREYNLDTETGVYGTVGLRWKF